MNAKADKYMKSGLLAFVFYLLWAIYSPEAVLADQGSEGNLKFKWAFVVQEIGDGGERLQTITQDRALKSGDKVKMLVELEQKCFIYVIHHSPEGGISLLFPYKTDQFMNDYEVQKKYYIPKGGAWFQLDQDSGRETFYLLASDHRLTELETLIEQYGSGADQRPVLAQQIIGEIRELRKKHQELSAPAERPVTIGGTIRGFEKPRETDVTDLASLSQEISASGFYARTFTIDHE